jgi:hypothetical protein
MAKNDKTVEDLITELETPPRSAEVSPKGKGGLWLLPLALLSLGFAAGWIAAGFRPPAHGSATTKPGQTTRQDLLAAGWQESDQGVFTRRCQDNCRTPVVYGGGMADVMEVHCLDRPCGEIRAAFVVLDDRGQVVHEVIEGRPGRQGERLQLVIESQRPEARRFVLQSFSAKARID